MKQQMRVNYFLGIISILVYGCQFSKQNVQRPPNILLIVSEDHSPHLSCYGDTVIKTPNLDKIAEEGILFRNAYVTESICSPSRSSILTGLYPCQNGQLGTAAHGYHLVGEVANIYQSLKNAGYRTGMIGKLHLKPEGSFPIDFHPIKESNYKKLGLRRYSEFADSFMVKSSEPFFLMVNLPDAHGDWEDRVEGRPANPVSVADVTTFPHIGLDNERLRGITTSYYNCILRMDECVGELMARLNQPGLRDNTLIIYLSDHGDQMGRGKVYLYEAGVKVPFIVSWPGKIPRGIESEALISTIDIVPTILEAAGLHNPGNLPGRSLSPLFKNPDKKIREYIFTERNCNARMFHYPQRAVRDNRFKLIYTLLENRGDPVAIYFHDRPDTYIGTPKLKEIEKAGGQLKRIYDILLYPPKIQLYDLENDPWEFNDLSGDPDYGIIKQNLLDTLLNNMDKIKDPLRSPENLRKLTLEHDSVAKITDYVDWKYPKYLYGIK
jgi:N-sulfoglucosamine sulfohydrolase